jgi:hypothetical protein
MSLYDKGDKFLTSEAKGREQASLACNLSTQTRAHVKLKLITGAGDGVVGIIEMRKLVKRAAHCMSFS